MHELVIMPNHVHGIVILDEHFEDTDIKQPPVGNGPSAVPPSSGPSAVMPSSLSLFDVMHHFKSRTTARYAMAVAEQGWPRFQGKLWQKSYFERVIRTEQELEQVRKYIVQNPLKWALDRENPDRRR